MLTIYGRKSSFNLQKVMWLVAELGIAHNHVELGGSFGGLDTAEFLAMNPHGRVPVMDDSSIVVWESHAILRMSRPSTLQILPFGTLTRQSGRRRINGWTGRKRRCKSRS